MHDGIECKPNKQENHRVSGEFLKKGSKNWIPGMYHIYICIWFEYVKSIH